MGGGLSTLHIWVVVPFVPDGRLPSTPTKVLPFDPSEILPTLARWSLLGRTSSSYPHVSRPLSYLLIDIPPQINPKSRVWNMSRWLWITCTNNDNRCCNYGVVCRRGLSPRPQNGVCKPPTLTQPTLQLLQYSSTQHQELNNVKSIGMVASNFTPLKLIRQNA